MKIVTEMTIHAHPDTVFRIAQDIGHWPDILPHYQWVQILGQTHGGRVAEMTIVRCHIPMRYTVVQTMDCRKRCINYRHIYGITKGMEVTWRIVADNGITRVVITHELTFKHPLLSLTLGRSIMNRLCVQHIALRTLQQMKAYIEDGALHDQLVPGETASLRLSA